MLAGDAGHAHPDGVDAVAHRGFGQAPVARHVPAARQRLGLAGVAPQQVVVGVDLAGHDDGFERQRGRSATRAVTAPVDPVPGLAGMAGPARAQSSGSVTGRQAGPSAGRAPSGRAWAMRTSRIRAAQSPAASAVAARAPPHRISSASRRALRPAPVRRAAPPASAASIEQAARARRVDGPGARGHRQLAVDVLDVAFDGVAGQMQLVGDLPVAQPSATRCRIWSSRGLSVSPGGGLAGCAGAGRSSAMMRRATKGSIGAPPRSTLRSEISTSGRRVPSAGSRWRRRAAPPEWRPRCSRPR